MEARPLLQALSGRKIKDYHEATHFTIGWDFRPESKVVVTQHQVDFPAHCGDFRRQVALPPQSSDVLNKEEGQPYQLCTETMVEYQGKPLAHQATIYPTPAGGMIPVDPSERRPLPVTRASYRWPGDIRRPEKIVPDKWQTRIILGDDESVRPITSYQESYKDPLKHRLHRRDETGRSEYLGDYPANGRLPALPPTESESATEKWTVKTTPPKGPRPDPKKRWGRANAPADEREKKFESTMATDYQWKACEPHKSSKWPDVMFSIINGDASAGKGVEKATTYSRFYGKPTHENMRRTLSHPQKEASFYVTIPGQLVSYSTTYKEHFQPAPPGYRKAERAKLDLHKSNF